MAVGSLWPFNIKAEVYDFGTGDWTTVRDYPYAAGFFADYDMVYVPATSAYYVIGGSNGYNGLAKIGMFKNGAWSEAGQLNTARPVSFLFVSVLLIQFSVSLKHKAQENFHSTPTLYPPQPSPPD